MKHKLSKRILSSLLILAMLMGLFPASVLTVHAGHSCSECYEWIDGSPYCSECYACEECVELCIECGKCTGCTGSDICDGCTSDAGYNTCVECAMEKGAHCPECDSCYLLEESWCAECGRCETCSDICDDCSVNLGFGLICWDCVDDKESHCPGCGGCYFTTGLWCEDCSLCSDCVEIDQECSSAHGAILCHDCAAERGNHCPECAQCYFDVGSWCEECLKCEDCSPACLYCCEEAGTVICEECAIEAGMHCPECSDCYSGGEFCTECGVCTGCADICATDELCMECAIMGGYHCPSCEECGDQAKLCDECGEVCSECADAFCENCNLCSQCVVVCPNCGSCEECAEICPNCEEYCSECEDICGDCEFCVICCADIAGFHGCDCATPICVESDGWKEHFDQTHTETEDSHNARPVASWTWNDTHHWHGCAYCKDDSHLTAKSTHDYDVTGKCKTCYYVKDAKIHILIQPKEDKNVFVTGAYEDYDERNFARFSTKAIGNSTLTYTWCRLQYVGGVLQYVPLKYPLEGECYSGPEASILVPEDACYNEYTYACIITDEEGNEVKTVDVTLTARHDYHYFKQWRTHQTPYESAERTQYGHILQCIGTSCEKVTRLLPHEDEDRNAICDVCDYEIGKILITKQPKEDKKACVSSAIEDYDESNFAHFSVKAEGESKLTYTWCRKQYVGGVLQYVPLKYPLEGECYSGPEASILVPEDACYNEYTYACIITDEDGNETRTVDVPLLARHNYQYYQQYRTHENPYPDARKRYTSHVLVCVGTGCEKVTRYRQHEDADHDYFCDICDSEKDILTPGITVTEPREGQMPDYNVISDSPAYFAPGSSSYYGSYRVWMESDDGENWKAADPTYPFQEGKYYKFHVEMHTAEGYEFPPMANYGGDKFFWVLVNGNYVKAREVSGMDPLHHVAVECDFGMCSDSGAELRVIENIVLDGIEEPVAGELPDYECNVGGVGYTLNQAYNNGTYVIGGIAWYDVTYDMWMYPDKPFRAGHEYKVFIDVKTEDGYWFRTSGTGYKPAGEGHINGNAAVLGRTFDARFEQSLSTAFTCLPKTVNAVKVSGLSLPRDGATPDFTAVTDSEFYTVDSIVWMDYENNAEEMTSTDTFVAGNEYWVLITVVPTKEEGKENCQFVKDKTKAALNGIEVKKDKNAHWQEVESSAKRVKIYYTFHALHENTGVVKGSFISHNTEDAKVQLYPQGSSSPAYEVTVLGIENRYCFDEVANGVYTLKATKPGHSPFECTVTVNNDIVICDVVLSVFVPQYERGDLDGNDKVNSADAIYLLYYTLFGETRYPVEQEVDYDKNGTVNSADAIYLLYHTLFGDTRYPLD